METIGRREEETTMLCRILAMPVKHWVFILVLILLFLALYTVLFAEEAGSPTCDLQSGLAGVLNLSQQQCEDMQRVTDRFFDDTAPIRNKIVEKRFELKDLSRTPKSDPNVIDRKGQELNNLEQEFSRRVRHTELEQRRFLTSEQLTKIRNTTSSKNVLPPARKRYEAK